MPEETEFYFNLIVQELENASLGELKTVLAFIRG